MKRETCNDMARRAQRRESRFFSRTRILVILSAFLAAFLAVPGPAMVPASAKSSGAGVSMEAFLACQRIEKRKARYRCYDSLESGDAPPPAVVAAPSNVPTNAPSNSPSNAPSNSPAKATAAAIPDETQRRRDFGQSEAKERKKSRESIKVEIVSVSRNKSGIRIFRTKEGQVWRQSGSEWFHSGKGGFSGEIRKGALGGYFLTRDGSRRRVRVKRIK